MDLATGIGLVAVGLFAGSLSATLGIGGGVVMVPALAILFGFDQHVAQGTSLAIIVPTTVVGAWVHARAGRVDWRIFGPVALASVAGGVAGAALALDLEGDVLRRLFAVLLVVLAVRMLPRTIRSRSASG